MKDTREARKRYVKPQVRRIKLRAGHGILAQCRTEELISDLGAVDPGVCRLVGCLGDAAG